nr:uncharacterized protein LOC109738032 [Aegilops tauschii subsp. strangulata]
MLRCDYLLELEVFFAGTRAASGKTWNNDEMRRAHDDCYFQAAERSGELRVTMMAVAVVGWDELGAMAMEGLPERRDSCSCAGGGSDAMDFGDLGRILSFFLFFLSCVFECESGGPNAPNLTVGNQRSGRTGWDRPKFSAGAPAPITGHALILLKLEDPLLIQQRGTHILGPDKCHMCGMNTWQL